MHRNKCSCSGITERFNKIAWIIVVRFHKPSRFVSSDSDKKIADVWEKLADLAIMPAVSAVASEVDGCGLALDNKAAPKTFVRIEQPPPRPVTNGNKKDLHRAAGIVLLEPASGGDRIRRRFPFVENLV